MARPRPSMTMDEAWLATLSQQLHASHALRNITAAGEHRYLRLAAHSAVRAAGLLRAKGGPALPAITAFDKEIEKDAAFLGLDLDPKASPEAPMIAGGSWDTPDALIEPRFLRRARRLTSRLVTALKAALPPEMEPHFFFLGRVWHEPMGVLGCQEMLKAELDAALAERERKPALAMRLFTRVIAGTNQGLYAVRDYAQGEIEEWEAGGRAERLHRTWVA